MAEFWNDLNAVRGAVHDITGDVCVIGSGPAGLAVTRALAERGVDVVLLERGGAQDANANTGESVAFDRREYRGATTGRAFGPGGTSALWGGQLLPVLPTDIAARPHVCSLPWPMEYDTLQPHFDRLERWLDVCDLPFGSSLPDRCGHPLAALDWGSFAPRFSKWIAFGRRNLAVAWESALQRTTLVHAWKNARVVSFQTTPGARGRRVTQVDAQSPTGTRLRVAANTVVFAAGAIETAALALLLQMQGGLDAVPGHACLGRYLHDHLSLRVGKLAIRDRRRFLALFAPFFNGSTMRSLRLEFAPELARSLHLPALYVHFVAAAADDSGFALLRDMLRAAQRRDFRAVMRNVLRMPMAMPSVAAMLYWRYVRKRLAFPRGAEIFVHVDFEQPASARNRVYLDHGHLHVDWDLEVDPLTVASPVKRELQETWSRNALDRVATIEFFRDDTIRRAGLSNLYDIYHAAGTTRMGAQPAEAAVGPDLRFFGSENVYAVSSSVFPSMGAANPTFTIMALGVKLAEELCQCR